MKSKKSAKTVIKRVPGEEFAFLKKYNELTEEELEIIGFHKHNPNNNIWWLNNRGSIGEMVFSFDKKKCYSLYGDYPNELTKEERELFDKEEPFWKELWCL